MILLKYSPMEFTFIKCRAMTLSRFPQCRAFSRAVMDENFPIDVRVGLGDSGYKSLMH